MAVRPRPHDFVAATGDSKRFNGGTDNDQMVAAAGHLSNFYIFAPGSGQDSITGFEGANGDVADLRGFGIANFGRLPPRAVGTLREFGLPAIAL